MTTWIDPSFEDGDYKVGQVGFLCSSEHEHHGKEVFFLLDEPMCTNLSCEPRLHGWCGTTNNVHHMAYGVAKITKVAKNGRALVRKLTVNEEIEFFEIGKEIC